MPKVSGLRVAEQERMPRSEPLLWHHLPHGAHPAPQTLAGQPLETARRTKSQEGKEDARGGVLEREESLLSSTFRTP